MSLREVRRDRLGCGLLYAWPGAVFSVNGTPQSIIDDRADEV